MSLYKGESQLWGSGDSTELNYDYGMSTYLSTAECDLETQRIAEVS